MATLQQVQDDLNQIKQQTGDYIAARDAIDAVLNQTIADLQAQLAGLLVQLNAALANDATDAATIASLTQQIADTQVAVDAAFTTAEEAKALLVPPVTPTP